MLLLLCAPSVPREICMPLSRSFIRHDSKQLKLLYGVVGGVYIAPDIDAHIFFIRWMLCAASTRFPSTRRAFEPLCRRLAISRQNLVVSRPSVSEICVCSSTSFFHRTPRRGQTAQVRYYRAHGGQGRGDQRLFLTPDQRSTNAVAAPNVSSVSTEGFSKTVTPDTPQPILLATGAIASAK